MNMKKPPVSSRQAGNWKLALLAAMMSAGCASPPAGPASPADAGIEIHGLHLSAHGYVLDMRYRVRDPVKAASLLDSKKKVYLIDDARQARLGVPESPVIGGMRQTSRNRAVYTDRDYFILFVNPGRAVRVGDIVQLAVDGRKIAQLTVQ
jgi:hypothetical protein